MLKFFSAKSTWLVIGLLLGGLAAFTFWPERIDLAHLQSSGDHYNARILRDTWGVPHIYGQTDADAAFGLAYAHAEDDFLTIQQTLLAAQGQLASVEGYSAAPIDYSVSLLRVWDVVEAEYGRLPTDTRALLEAYAAGVNRYAFQHPDQALSADLFPITGPDILATAVQKLPLFYQLDAVLTELYGDAPPKKKHTSPSAGLARFGEERYGSNVFAIAPSRSASGDTLLAANSHQPWTGPVAWYEAHVHSEQGWDMVGATFPATPLIILGHNRHLGWSFTVSHPDLIDVYQLEMNPDQPNQYRFDDQWRDLEVRSAPITIRLAGRLKWTVTQEALWSVHGPVVRRPHGVYAIRYAGFGRADIFDQLYRMNKATNFTEWQTAMRAMALPTFNVGYADREGNIYYLYNANLPQRAPGYDWANVLPGNTSATVWTEYWPFERLPQTLNPPAGFILNANSSPFSVTLGAGNANQADYPPEYGVDRRLTNRMFRLQELLGGDDSITFDEFLTYKYDMTYSPQSDVAQYVARLINAPSPSDPVVRAGVDALRHWDLRATPDSTGTGLMVLTLHYLWKGDTGLEPDALVGLAVTEEQLLTAFTEAAQTLQRNFGQVDPLWGAVNRLRRGTMDLAIGGGPDLLHAVYGDLQNDGRLTGIAGDCYILIARWDQQGALTSYSIHQFGSATLDPTSPHYADQAPLFAQRNLKPIWFTDAEIRAHLEREYRP